MASNTPQRLATAHEQFRGNRLDAAEAELALVLAEEPENATARQMLVAIYIRTGRLNEAERDLNDALAFDPDQTEGIGLLAVVKVGRGDFFGAAQCFERLIELGVLTPDVWNKLGSCRLQIGDPIAAGQAFKRAIELDRTAAHSFYNLGMALMLAGNSFETFATFRRAIELDPSFQDSYVQLWQQMRRLLNWREGLALLEAGLKRFPNSARMKVMLASTYGKLGRQGDAERLFKEAVALDSAAGPPYAHWLQENGQFEASVPILEEAIRQNPVQGEAYYNLAIAKRFESGGRPLEAILEPLLENSAVGPEGQMFLAYALAKVYDERREFGTAMGFYRQANARAYKLYNSAIHDDPEAVQAEHAVLERLYSSAEVMRHTGRGSSSEAPIFIVGMIRTGTTLLDQILSSHPQVKSAGEQPFWQISSGRVNRRWLETGFDPKDLDELAAGYLAVLREAAGESDRFTDKMPTNFAHMGLMHRVFPNAKFVHMRRNPLDTCISIYTTFLGSGTQFAYDEENIVSYYAAYRQTMDHWLSVLPSESVIEVEYEELVANPEPVLRRLLGFCGLPWADECLAHEDNVAPVSTPSLWAARQPVNTRSVERWRRYEPWLGKLKEVERFASLKDR